MVVFGICLWVNSVDLHVPLMVCCVIVYLVCCSLVGWGVVGFDSCLAYCDDAWGAI